MKRSLPAIFLSLALVFHAAAPAAEKNAAEANTMSFFFRDVPVAELFEMLSRKERVSIMLSRGVTGTVTVNLYDMTLKQAIHAIAEAAGYAVEERDGGYMILDRREASTRRAPSSLSIRSLRVLYSNPEKVASVLSKHLSESGRITVLDDRRMLIAEDTPEVLDRIENLMREVDKQPTQILIEAKILEITLDASDSFGIDWSHIFGANNLSSVGTQGLATRGTPGFFFNLVNDNIRLYLSALSSKGKVHTLATPKLLTLDNQEAITNVGDKIGYRVTTTINNVSTESIQFLETGIILRVTPSVDADGRIAMKIRPEVSSGSLSSGVPSKKSTEVTTQLIAADGQSVMIAGLIKNSNGYRRSGVPILSDVPALGTLFSKTENLDLATETVVIITPRIVRSGDSPDKAVMGKMNESATMLDGRKQEIDETLKHLMLPAARTDSADPFQRQ